MHLDLSILTPTKNKPGIHFFKDNVEGYLQAKKKEQVTCSQKWY
jgi:hypothetical protein